MLARIGSVSPSDRKGLGTLAGQDGRLDWAPFGQPVSDYFLTNPVARSSAVMAELSRLAILAAEAKAAERVAGKRHG
jgi:NADH-quinone oxidoreductase subunit G